MNLHRVKRTFRALSAATTASEDELAKRILGPELAPLFFSMPIADRRHSLDILASMEKWKGQDGRVGLSDIERRFILIHDAGKAGADIKVRHRVIYVILGGLVPVFLNLLPSSLPLARSMRVLYNHPETGKKEAGKLTAEGELLSMIEAHHTPAEAGGFLSEFQRFDGRY